MQDHLKIRIRRIEDNMSKIDVNNINLEIDDIEVWKPKNPEKNMHRGLIRIRWNSSIGFGEYDLCKDGNGNWVGYSETMDSNEDKDFIKKLMELFIERLTIID
jgi:hypothetical protein